MSAEELQRLEQTLHAEIPLTRAMEIRVLGFDSRQQMREVRARIGFMPENNPLHPEMRVREYLKFRARIKGLGIAASRERPILCGASSPLRRICYRIFVIPASRIRRR